MEVGGGGERGELFHGDAVVEGWAGRAFDLGDVDHDDFAPGAEEARGLAEEGGGVVGFVEDVGDEDAVDSGVGEGDTGFLGVNGLDAGDAGVGGAALEHLEQLGLDVYGVDAAGGADELGGGQGEEAGAGAEVYHVMAGADAGGAEDLLGGQRLLALCADKAGGVGRTEVVGAVALGDVLRARVIVSVSVRVGVVLGVSVRIRRRSHG